MRYSVMILLLVAFAVMTRSMLIMPGTGFADAEVPSEAYPEVTKCKALTMKMGVKLSQFVWDLVSNWPMLMTDLNEIWQITKEAIWACMFSY